MPRISLKPGKELGMVFLLVGISLILRLGYNLTLDNEVPFRADAGKYITIAHNLVNHGVYSLDSVLPLTISTLITPGYPLFLSAILKITGELQLAYTTILILQALFGAGSALLVYIIARQCNIPKPAAFVALALISFYPHQITSGGLVLTESLFTLLIMCTVSLIILGIGNKSKTIWIFAGITLGLAALTRPIALPIGIGIWLTFYLLQPHLNISKRSLPIAIIPVLLYAPWIAFSNIHHDEHQVSNAKAVFALGTYPNFTYQSERYFGFPHREDPNFAKMQQSLSFTVSELKRRASEEPSKYVYWYTLGKPTTLWQWDIIQGAGGANIYPIKHSLYDSSSLYSQSFSSLKILHPILVLLAFFASILFILRSFVSRLDKEKAATLVLAAIFIYIAIAHTLMASLPRFSIPFQPIMIVLAISWLSFGSKERGTEK